MSARRSSMRRNASSSPYAAYQLMKDGRAHSLDEIWKKLGPNGARRIRELRSRRFGGFDVVAGLTDGVRWYQISKAELASKQKAANCLEAGVPFQSENRMEHTVRMTVAVQDLVLLRGLITDDAEMRDSDVAKLWSDRKNRILNEIAGLLRDDDPQSPVELFGDD